MSTDNNRDIISSMYLLYIDESIDKNLISLGGTLISDMKCRKFYEDFNTFIKRDLGFSEEVEIHADAIWNGRGDFLHLDMGQRADITCRIAKFIGESNLSRLYYSQRFIEGGDRNELYLDILNNLLQSATKVVSEAGSTNKQLLLIFDQRSDIKGDILGNLLEQHNRIVKEYRSSCFLIDCGYEGVSKYSRLLQVADFVAFWGRNIHIIREQSSLFSIANDSRRIALVKSIKDFWGNKFKEIR